MGERVERAASVQGQNMHENETARIVVDPAVQIRRELGPGLFESIHSSVLTLELRERRIAVACEVPIPIVWRDIPIGIGFRADLIVDGKLIVEIKSVEALQSMHHKQLLTYLKLANCRLGLLINFGAPLLKNGIVRLVNGLCDDGESPER